MVIEWEFLVIEWEFMVIEWDMNGIIVEFWDD